jgi:hypothetical protein
MAVIYGESNSGKTFFATDLALHVAAGRPWRGRAIEGGLVVYLALEGSLGIRNRITAWRDEMGLGDYDLPFIVVPVSVNLLNVDADAAAVIARAQAVVVPEGGLHHTAAVFGTPAVVIYGGFISPEVTGYAGQTAMYAKSDEHPLGCGWRVPCTHCQQAMASIVPETVADELEKQLAKPAAGHQGMVGPVVACA